MDVCLHKPRCVSDISALGVSSIPGNKESAWPLCCMCFHMQYPEDSGSSAEGAEILVRAQRPHHPGAGLADVTTPACRAVPFWVPDLPRWGLCPVLLTAGLLASPPARLSLAPLPSQALALSLCSPWSLQPPETGSFAMVVHLGHAHGHRHHHRQHSRVDPDMSSFPPRSHFLLVPPAGLSDVMSQS